MLWPLQVARLAWRWRAEGRTGMEAALFTVAGKVAEAQGVIGFHLARWRGRRTRLIEYK